MFGLLKTILSKETPEGSVSKREKSLDFSYHRFSTNKNNSKYRYLKNIQKGKEYEKFIGNLFEKSGYIVKYNGIESGKKDSSIDLIAIKGETLVLIQCKNWKKDGRKISHKDIKSFIGDTYTFIHKNRQYQQYKKIKRLYCVSNDIFDKSALAYMNQNKEYIEYRVKPMEKLESTV